MDTLDLTVLTAAEIVARVHDGSSGAVDVARAHLARIAEHDARIGAFRVVDAPRVLAEAAAVDSRADRFALALAGVPVAVTDDVDVAGYRSHRTGGTPARRDDELVRRLRAAGAVVIGKTRSSATAAVDAGMATLVLGGGTGRIDGHRFAAGGVRGSARTAVDLALLRGVLARSTAGRTLLGHPGRPTHRAGDPDLLTGLISGPGDR